MIETGYWRRRVRLPARSIDVALWPYLRAAGWRYDLATDSLIGWIYEQPHTCRTPRAFR
jgi:hypothetical protein